MTKKDFSKAKMPKDKTIEVRAKQLWEENGKLVGTENYYREQAEKELSNPKTRNILTSIIKFFWKTLPTSDWMKLLAVPLILSFAGSIITSQIQRENRQNELVNKYFEQMEKLFTNEKLDFSKSDNHLRILIKSQSKAVVRSADLKRKEIIIEFLAEAGLLVNDKEKEKKIEGVSLSYLDFTEDYFDITKINNSFRGSVGINLSGFNLRKGRFNNTDFSNANLYAASLQGASLYRANLTDADLERANLSRASLIRANLTDADLEYASLYRANLTDANLTDADLSGALLHGAYLSGAKNLTNQQVKKACNWENAYFARYWNSEKGEWVDDEEKQKAKIKELKEDKDSEPKVKPICDHWNKK